MAERESSLPSLTGLSVLIVDDNQNMRRLLHTLLRAMRIDKIRDVASGQEALAMLHDFKADVVITDLAMKPLNGIDFVRVLRSDPKSPAPKVPVLMLTGYCEEAIVVKARKAGVNDFVAKPVSAKMLADRISRLIDAARLVGPVC